MKRHESIAPLSREHHANLILAQLLKSDVEDYKGLPSSPEDKRTYALDIYYKEIKNHFLKEEKVFDLISHHEELFRALSELKEEHKIISDYFENLPLDDSLPEKLNELGIALDNHIRKEERIVFPLIQQVCSEVEFSKISGVL